MKTTTIQARIQPELKTEVEAILATLGLTPSDAISIYFRQIQMHQGIPFEVRVPKKSLEKALRDVQSRKNLTRAKNSHDLAAQLSSHARA